MNKVIMNFTEKESLKINKKYNNIKQPLIYLEQELRAIKKQLKEEFNIELITNAETKAEVSWVTVKATELLGEKRQ